MKIRRELRGDLTVMTVSETADANDIIRAIDDFYAGDPTDKILWDFTEADLDSIEVADINRLAQTSRGYAERREQGRTALVFSRDVGYGLGRMFGTLQEVKGSSIKYRSFRSLDEAMTWIDSETEEES